MIVGDLVDAGVAEIRTGPFGTQLKASDYVDTGRPVLNVRNVGFGDVRAEKLEYVDEQTADRLSGHLLQSGDIVFGRKGAVERHAFIAREFVGALQGSDCIRLRLSEGAPVRPHFASFALRTAEHQAWMQAFCSHGATMASLNQDILRQIQLPDLPLIVQDAVIDVLGSIDDLIEINRRRVEVLEEMARAIYREWFVHFRYPGHEHVPLVDSPLGPIPDGWEVTPFSDIATFVNGFAFKPAHWSDSGRPIIKIKQLKQGVGPDTPRCEENEIDRKYWVESGDLLFSWSADLGVYRWAEEPGLLNQHLFTVRPAGDLSLAFLFHALDVAMPRFRDRAQGTTMRHIKRSALTEVSTAVPDPQAVSSFTAAVEPMAQEAISMTGAVRELSEIRDLLLPKLVTGQIDVSHLDLDALTEVATA